MGPESNPRLAASFRNMENTKSHGQGMPTTFFIASEEDLEKSQSPATGSDSIFGVKSIEEAAASVAEEVSQSEEETKGDRDSHESELTRRRSTLKPTVKPRDLTPETFQTAFPNTINSSSNRKLRRFSPPSASQSLASLSLASQDPGSSVPSSPKSNSSHSYRPSDEESMYEGGSQAIASSEEDEGEISSEVRESAPQLIMPSIKMPSRRPFTDRGKDFGRLKILIAGDSGVGKTSLIKSIVQTCEDIVHVDPLSPTASTDQLRPRKGTFRQDSTAAKPNGRITEVYASTKTYASWWSETDDYRFFRIRKSMGDTVLERNLCFVDTPGYSQGISMIEGIETVVQYVEDQLAKTFCFANSTEGEIVSMMGGDGGAQVDLVLYLISKDIKAADLDFIRRLSAITNVVPLIAKADLLSPEDTKASKVAIAGQLQAAGIKPFTLHSNASGDPTYTVCSALSKDEETMDASLLMSPDYVQPLLSSELGPLVQDIFNKDHISRLRHLAAMKLIRHRTSSQSSLSSPLYPSPFNLLQNSSLLLSSISTTTSPAVSQSLITHQTATSSYVQARIADHTLREEKLAQMRLAKWAGDLQRGLQNERARYEALARRERALWLTQRVAECANEGSLVPVGTSAALEDEKGLVSWRAERSIDAGDPLGLVRWSDGVKRKGWIAFQVVGGFGILSAVAVWMARNLAGWEGGGLVGKMERPFGVGLRH